MSKMEKRMNIDFNSLIIHQLYTEIAPALTVLEEEFNQKFEKLSSGVNEYVNLNPIKVIEKGERYEVVSGIAPYLKIFRKVSKINVIQILSLKYNVEAVIAADILTSDLHLWHPQALIIHAGVLSYLQTHPSITSKVEEMTWLIINPMNDFLNSSSIMKRSVYYDLKQKYYMKTDFEKSKPEIYSAKTPKATLTSTFPMRMLPEADSDALLSLSFDSEQQLVSAHIVNFQTNTDITEQVRCLEESTRRILLSISLDKDYVFEVHFLDHIDFIDNENRLVLMFHDRQIKGGRLFSKTGEVYVRCSKQAEIIIDHNKTSIGKLTKDSDIYTFHPINSNSRLVSTVNDVLIKPIVEVQS